MRIGVYVGALHIENRLALPPSWSVAASAETCDLAVIRDAEMVRGRLHCGTALLWEEACASLTQRLCCEQIVGCGFSPRNSLTLASLAPQRAVLSVQRAIVGMDGRCIPPQDIPLPREWAAWSAEEQLLLAGVALLTGGLEAAKSDYK